MLIKETSLSKILFNLSHDIRSSYSSAFGLLSILEDELNSNDKTDCINLANRLSLSLKNIFSISEHLQDLSKLETGFYNIKKVEMKPYFELKILLEDVLVKFKHLQNRIIVKANNENLIVLQDMILFEKTMSVLINSLGLISTDINLEISSDIINNEKIFLEITGSTNQKDIELIKLLDETGSEKYFQKSKFNVLYALGIISFIKYADLINIGFHVENASVNFYKIILTLN